MCDLVNCAPASRRSYEAAHLGAHRQGELKEFLRSLRARLNPEDIGLPSCERRRVPCLRREELAQLAGVSYAYYARLEQGYGETTSAEVMAAVAHSLRLAEEERDHLNRLAQPDRNRTPRVAPPSQRLRPTVQHLLDTLGVLAFVVSRRLDILGWNRLATIVFGHCAQLPPGERNVARQIFLSPAARDRSPNRPPHGCEGRRRSADECRQESRRCTTLLTDSRVVAEERGIPAVVSTA
ncbi:helix-turn-helix transcriptional regulator [Streptomyces viridochromogenes]|uniref:helix-turn-helix transcriptional regulator n=1 Tax=Streptomyces viridochromogenes TaxID=1938 RepID=UPI000A627E95